MRIKEYIMEDFYLDTNNAYQRLENEYLKYGKLIIACDFDDTIYDFHKKGRSYIYMVNLLKRWQKYADIIIFTGNGKEKYDFIRTYMKQLGISIYGINCDSVVKVGGRKLYANVYLDDRAGLRETFDMLNSLIYKIESGEVKITK